MKILFVLTYYRPHISGLTIYVQRLAEGLTKQGHTCTILTSQFHPQLAREEYIHGVRIARIPIWKRIHKGVVMPCFAAFLLKEAKKHDLISVHLPQFESGLIALLNRIVKKKIILTYHCDLLLPPGIFNRLIDLLVHTSNYLSGVFADKIVAYTHDYATFSHFLSKFPQKIDVIPPPVEIEQVSKNEVAEFKKKYALSQKPIIGLAARLAFEKGVDYLLHALPLISTYFPTAAIAIAGEYKDVLGENVYTTLKPLFEKYRDQVKLLGVLQGKELAAFYSSLDVLTLPSINSTESFGLVQVEAMLSGTPVVASNLPGVRVPVQTTGMGEIVAIKDSQALAQGIIKVLKNPEHYYQSRNYVEEKFSLALTITKYEKLFQSLLSHV